MPGAIGGYAGKAGWSAGLTNWLDSADSKVNRYWRIIEEGTGEDWLGRPITGLWADTPTNFPLAGNPFSSAINEKLRPSFPKGAQGNDRAMLGAARRALWVYMGGGKGPNMDLLNVSYVWKYDYQAWGKHRFVKAGSGRREAIRTASDRKRAQESLFHWFMTKAESADEIPFVSGRIKKPIPGRHYYAKAMSQFRPQLVEMEREAIMEAAYWAIGHVRPGQAFAKFREAAGEEPGHRRRAGRPRREVTDARLAQLGAGGPAVFTVAATVQLQYSMRGGGGQFINGDFQYTLRQANARVAQAYLERVAALMTSHRPTNNNALLKATTDRRNRYPNDDL